MKTRGGWRDDYEVYFYLMKNTPLLLGFKGSHDTPCSDKQAVKGLLM